MKFIFAFVILNLFLTSATAQILKPSPKSICGPFYILEKQLFFTQFFSKNDKLLICGSEAPGWGSIPENQALFHIKSILEAKGYFSPQIKKEKDRILIDPGEVSRIKNIRFQSDPPDFQDKIFRGVKDKPMTPEALENIKDWTYSRLRAMGYPCPQVAIQAGYEDESILVKINPGQRLHLMEVIRPVDLDLKPQVFERHEAFDVGDWFNGDLLSLTSRRLVENDIVQFSHFEDYCLPRGAVAKEVALLGKPRTLIFAIGASTEELPIFKTEWKNSRLDEYGSSVLVTLYTSPRLQSLKTSSELYWIPSLPPFYILPSAEIRRESEPTYKAILQEFQLGVGHKNDDSRHRYAFSYLPTYTIENTLEGEGPGRIQYFSFETGFQMTSHYFEFFRMTPQEGYQLAASWKAQRQGLGSEFSADLLKISGTHLWNLGRLDPPLTVVGVRFGHSVVTTAQIDEIPASFRLFLGGAEDVRGFSRKSINNLNLGYQTTSFLGLEGRFLEVLPYKLQPFIFSDFAKVGDQAWEWNKDTYLSPGLGVRWQSPIGALRGTVARGYILNQDNTKSQPNQELNFYLSYGREF